ncbi:unnamed protein product [Rhodiola kirilowii]
MSDSRDKGLHFHGGAGVGAYGGYNYNSAGGYPSVGGYGGYPSQAGGYPPVAYPPPSGYPPQAAAYPGHCHSGHGGLGALIGAVARYGAGHMMSHGHGHGGYVAHGGHGNGYGYHHHGKFKHGKFGKHGKFKHTGNLASMGTENGSDSTEGFHHCLNKYLYKKIHIGKINVAPRVFTYVDNFLCDLIPTSPYAPLVSSV